MTSDSSMTEKQKMCQGLYYDCTDEELVSLRNKVRAKLQEFNTSKQEDEPKRQAILKEILGQMGDKCFIEPSLRLDYGFNITLGYNVQINFDCVMLDVCQITIGDNVLFGPGVHLYTATHPTDPEERRKGLEFGKPIKIGDDCWLGGRSVVCPGVTIGNGVTVAAGAVVTKDIPDRVVVAGVPAKIIKYL